MIRKLALLCVCITLVTHGRAQFDYSSMFSSDETEDSRELTSDSDEYNSQETNSTEYAQRPTTSYTGCQVEQIKRYRGFESYYAYPPAPPSRYPAQSTTTYSYLSYMRDHYQTSSFLKCRNVLLTSGKPLEIYDKTQNLKYVIFEHCNIPSVPVGVFAALNNFAQLYQLYLNDSYVNTVQSGAFAGLDSLQELYLQNNNITRLSHGTFAYLQRLKVLNLRNNTLETIEENTFSGLPSLSDLYLNNNNIKNLLPDTFNNLTLESLDLSYNRLSDVSKVVFFKLSSLNLSHNKLTAVNFSKFPTEIESIYLDNNQIGILENLNKLSNARQLSLSNNSISKIEVLSNNLLSLNLSRNQIGELNSSVFNQLEDLAVLDLSHNFLVHLNQDVFENSSNLEELYLQKNKLNSIPIGCFRSLHFLRLLNLSSNEIAEFELGTFGGLSGLENLDISNNKLGYLYENSFHALKHLKVLNIGYNFLTSFDPQGLLQHIRLLTTVALDNNPWTCKSLLNIVNVLENFHVNVANGSTRKSRNVHGIACLDQNFNNGTPTLVPSFKNEAEDATLTKLQAVADELKALQKFFDEDFANSSFYNYFKNINLTENFGHDYASVAFLRKLDGVLKNTTFNAVLSKVNTFKQLEELFSDLISELHSLNVNFKNSTLNKFTDSNKVNQEFAKYFEDGFKDSSFYKYFNKDFLNSGFFKHINEDAQNTLNPDLAEISAELRSLRNYFDNGFKNSTFYRFFDRFRLNRGLENDITKELFVANSDVTASSAKHSNNPNYQENQDILTKISELQNAIVTLMVIVIVILLGMMLLYIVKKIYNPLIRSINKSSSGKSKANNSIAELELL